MTTHTQPEQSDEQLYKILADYSDDLANIRKRNGKLPADAAIAAIRAYYTAEIGAALELLKETAPRNLYTIDEVRERNKHLDSRTQQMAADRSRGIIETNNKWNAAIAAYEQNLKRKGLL